MEGFEFIIIIIWGIVWGFVAKAIGDSKGINGFWWGFFLGLIGVIVVACMQGKQVQPTETVYVEDTYQQQYKPQSHVDKYEALEKLAKLKQQNILTKEEFEEEKRRILDE